MCYFFVSNKIIPHGDPKSGSIGSCSGNVCQAHVINNQGARSFLIQGWVKGEKMEMNFKMSYAVLIGAIFSAVAFVSVFPVWLTVNGDLTSAGWEPFNGRDEIRMQDFFSYYTQYFPLITLMLAILSVVVFLPEFLAMGICTQGSSPSPSVSRWSCSLNSRTSRHSVSCRKR